MQGNTVSYVSQAFGETLYLTKHLAAQQQQVEATLLALGPTNIAQLKLQLGAQGWTSANRLYVNLVTFAGPEQGKLRLSYSTNTKNAEGKTIYNNIHLTPPPPYEAHFKALAGAVPAPPPKVNVLAQATTIAAPAAPPPSSDLKAILDQELQPIKLLLARLLNSHDVLADKTATMSSILQELVHTAGSDPAPDTEVPLLGQAESYYQHPGKRARTE